MRPPSRPRSQPRKRPSRDIGAGTRTRGTASSSRPTSRSSSALKCIYSRLAAALHVDAGEKRQADDEVGARRQDGEAMVAAEAPGHRAVRQRSEDRRRLDRKPPQPEELGDARRRREIADQRAACGYLAPPSRDAEFFGLWGLSVK